MQPAVKADAEVLNATGLHARPCHAIASTAGEFESSLQITCGGRSVDGRSILSLMTLGAAQGDVLQFEAQGRDAKDLVDALCALLASGFQERS